MQAHFLQHVPFEGPAAIADWLQACGYRVDGTRLYEGPGLPDLDGIDLLVVMGGPMSVNDEQTYPWLAGEKALLRDAIASGVAVLGVCLGAQLIASALGARIATNPLKEIGWFPVQATDVTGDHFQFPPQATVFHWHGETFDLPDGAVRLARSAACENQAFQFGDTVIGLQFHLETTPASAQALVANCRDELVPARFVQGEQEILSAPPSHYAAIGALLDQVLGHLHRRIART